MEFEGMHPADIKHDGQFGRIAHVFVFLLHVFFRAGIILDRVPEFDVGRPDLFEVMQHLDILFDGVLHYRRRSKHFTFSFIADYLHMDKKFKLPFSLAAVYSSPRMPSTLFLIRGIM